MGLFKSDSKPTPPTFNPNNQFDNSRTSAAQALQAFKPVAYQRGLQYFKNFDADGQQRDQTLLDPASNAARLGAAATTQKMRESRGGGSAFARAYADPNMLATQDSEQSRQEDQNAGLAFMAATGDTYNRNLGLVQQGDQMQQQALSDILNSDTSRANANQQGVTSTYNTWLAQPPQPSLFGQLLGSAITGGSQVATAKITFGCVAEGTLILMNDGTEQAVEELLPGDAIMAFNPAAPESPVASFVRQVIPGEEQEMVKVADLLVTPEHLIFIGQGLFTPADMVGPATAVFEWDHDKHGLVTRPAQLSHGHRGKPYYLGTDTPFTFIANGIAVHE
jgi:hypothetical protein